MCPDCHAPFSNQQACQEVFDLWSLQAMQLPSLSAARTVAFDAYCLQHPESYCVSGKSFAAHLCRLACALEYSGQPQVYKAIQRWLNSARPTKPKLPTERGHLTFAFVYNTEPSQQNQAVGVWVNDVWHAYRNHHATARMWIKQALGD